MKGCEIMHLRPMTAVYLIRGEKILLLYRIGSRVVGNSYTGSAGGHVEPEEYRDPRACVLRELKEETGLTEDALKGLALRYITMRNKNGEVRQNYYYFAELKEGFDVQNSTEGRLEWHDMTALDSLPMPVTARHVVDHYLMTGRYTNQLYGGITTGEGPVFAAMDDF